MAVARGLLLCGALLGSTGAGFATTPPAVDPTIRTVVSGGAWESATDSGTLRVLVRSLGWEHTRSQVQVQWLAADDAAQKLRVVANVPVAELNDATWANVDSVRFLSGPSNRVEVLYVIHGEGPQLRTVLVLKEPGKYTVEKP